MRDKILIIDDEANIVSMLKDYFEKAIVLCVQYINLWTGFRLEKDYDYRNHTNDHSEFCSRGYC